MPGRAPTPAKSNDQEAQATTLPRGVYLSVLGRVTQTAAPADLPLCPCQFHKSGLVCSERTPAPYHLVKTSSKRAAHTHTHRKASIFNPGSVAVLARPAGHTEGNQRTRQAIFAKRLHDRELRPPLPPRAQRSAGVSVNLTGGGGHFDRTFSFCPLSGGPGSDRLRGHPPSPPSV